MALLGGEPRVTNSRFQGLYEEADRPGYFACARGCRIQPMSVIPFPLTHPRHSVPAEPARDLPVRLRPDEVEALTQLDFYARARTHADNGTLDIDPEDEAQLIRYLEFHGLRLPRAVEAKQVLELCNDLRWSYGEAVRCAARGEADIAVRFPGLNAEKLQYVRAIASQERGEARDIARKLFTSRGGEVFLY